MDVGALATVVAVFDEFLRVIPGPTGVGEKDRHEDAAGDRPGKVGAQRWVAEPEANRDRRENRKSAWSDQLS